MPKSINVEVVMEAAIMYSALIFMPLYALVFISTLFDALKRIKNNQGIQGVGVACGISFALMMWTLSGVLLLNLG